jgi:hypothetical protein
VTLELFGTINVKPRGRMGQSAVNQAQAVNSAQQGKQLNAGTLPKILETFKPIIHGIGG